MAAGRYNTLQCETAAQPGYDGYLETIMLRVALF